MLQINVGTKLETQSDVCELLGRDGLWELHYDWSNSPIPRVGENLVLPIADFELKTSSPHGDEIFIRVDDVLYWIEDGEPKVSIGTTALWFA